MEPGVPIGMQGTASKPEHWFLGDTANHYIVLYKPVTFVGDDAIIEYWSWAEDVIVYVDRSA